MADDAQRQALDLEPSHPILHFESLLQIAPVGLFCTDAAGQYQYVNQRWCHWAEMPAKEAMGLGWVNALHPDDRDRVLTEWQQAVTQQQPYTTEYRLQSTTHTITWLFVQVVPQTNHQGHLVGYVGTLTDITERRQLEARYQQTQAVLEASQQQLQTSKAQLQDVLTNALAAFCSFRVFSNGDWVYDYYSAGSQALYGYTPEELLADKMLWISRIFPDDRDAIMPLLYGQIFKSETLTYEYRFYRKEGSLRWHLATLTSRYDATIHCWVVTIVAIDITERKQAEVALHESQALYKSLADSLPMNLFRKDRAGRYTFANQSFLEMTGLTLEELQGKTDYDLVSPELAACFQADDQRVFESGGVVESVQLCGDDKPIHVQSLKAPVRNAMGEIVEVQGLCWDISDRVRLEKERELHSIIIQNIAEGICLVRAVDGVIVYANPKFEHIFGYEPGELVGKHASTVNYADEKVNATEVYDTIAYHLDNFGEYTYETRNIKKDGTPFWCRATTSRFEHPEHGMVYVAVQSDISDRKQLELERQQAEIALQEKEEQLRLALDFSQVGLWDWETATDRLRWRANTACILGLPPGDYQVPSSAWFERVHPDDVALVRQRLQIALEQGSPYEIECRVVWDDGSIHWVFGRGRATYDAAGQPQRMVGTVLDISKQKQVEEALRTSENRLLRTLSGANAGLWEWDATTNSYYWSDQNYCLLGYAVGECIPSQAAWLERVHPEDRELVAAYTLENLGHSLARSSHEFKLTYRVLLPNGGIRWIEDIGEVTYDTAGNLLRINGIQIDVSDSKQAELELEEISTALSNAVEGIARLDPQGRYISVNRAYAEVGGYTPAEMIGREWQLTVHPEDLDSAIAAYQEMRQQGKAKVELRGLRKDGSCFYKEVTMVAAYDQKQQFTGHHCFLKDISDRKQAEAALLENQRFIQSIADATPNLLYVYDLIEQRNVYANSELATILGYSTEDVQDLGSSLLQDLLHPEDQENVFTNHQRFQTAQDGEVFEIEYRMRHKNGEWRWLLSRDTVFKRTADGIPQQIVGTATDITDRKQAEAALQESQRFIQSIADATPNLLYVYDLIEQRNVYTNRELGQVLGYTPEEVQAMGADLLPRLTHPADWEAVMAYDQRILTAQDGEVLDLEYRMRHKNGEWRWLTSRSTVFKRTADGLPQQIVATATDITERKQAEAALQESQQFIQSITDATPSILYVYDLLEQRHIYANFRLAQVLGYSLADIQFVGNRFLKQLIHPDDWANVATHYQRLATVEDGGVLEVEYRIWHKNGGWRWIVSRDTVFKRTEAGQVQQIMGTATDISDRKQLEVARRWAEIELRQAKEAAEAANRAKSEFLSRMSHELRTPLTAILGFAEVLAGDAQLRPEQRENLNIIRRSGTHLLSLINDVLQIAKIEAGGLSLDETSFDLHHLLTTVEQLLHIKAVSKHLILTLERANNVPQYIQTDENKLRQILINLLDNAIKFTEQGSVTLQVTCTRRETAGNPTDQTAALVSGPVRDQGNRRHSEAALYFRVIDTGAGIAPGELACLFNAFAQTETGRKSQEGVGLGLAISRQFAELMGGEITVQSQLGQGTIFTLMLPLRLPESSLRQHHQPYDGPSQSLHLVPSIVGLAPGQPTYRILIVDDSSDTRKILTHILSPLGFEVKEAVNGQVAIALWKSWHPHLIWMDMQMPVMDGYEATRWIREQEQSLSGQTASAQTTKIIALTASALESQRQAALAAGCNDFISKPFQSNLLLEKIAEHLNLRYAYENSQIDSASANGLEINPATPLDHTQAPPLLDAAALNRMPPSWIRDLHRAASRLSSSQCLQLIQQIPPTEANLRQQLLDLIDNFRFDSILELAHDAVDPQPSPDQTD